MLCEERFPDLPINWKMSRGEHSRCGGPVGSSFPRCQRTSGLCKGTRPLRAGDFRSANFPRRYRSRKTRKGIFSLAAKFYNELVRARPGTAASHFGPRPSRQ